MYVPGMSVGLWHVWGVLLLLLTFSSLSLELMGRRKRLARIVHHMLDPSCRTRHT